VITIILTQIYSQQRINNVNYGTTIIIAVMPVFSLFIFVVLANSTAQGLQILPNTQQIPSSSSSSPPSPPPSTQTASTPAKSIAVKITSPVRGQEVSIGKNLTVSGVTATATANNKDNNATPLHCNVFVIANDLKPYQPAKATGKEGAADYSTWSYVLSSKYTTIKQGQYNKITAKYTCSSNPEETSFFSVNVTGKADSPSSNTTATSKQHQQNITKTFNGANTTRQKTPNTANINSAIGNNSTSTVASISKTSSYEGLVYLDNSKSTGEADKAKSVSHDTPFILPFP
jgi:hypothetical protein